MFGEEKKLTDAIKDPEQKLGASYGVSTQNLSPTVYYPKLSKLVTAMYIVTDIMDKEEPIRLKLRTLGLEILSDMPTGQADINSLLRTRLSEKVQTILSFLDIALAINLISDMNYNILKKELVELSHSIKESNQINPVWLEEFLLHPSKVDGKKNTSYMDYTLNTKGHLAIKNQSNNGQNKTRIGVQRGGTLMKALSDKTNSLSDSNFEILKKQRRDDIIKSIKDNGGSATITDIKTKASGSLLGCGEKTLQRELMSMTKEGVLNKTGEKRWSRYFLIPKP